MPIDSRAAMAYVMDACATTGMFESTVGHEPKAAPNARTGLVGSVFQRDVRPVQSSGLAAASVRHLITLRIWISAQVEPQDQIELQLPNGVDAVLDYFIGHFQGLQGARYVDVFGADGEELSASYGWAQQDNKKFRIADITIPLVMNDTYAEVA